jgi:hypothetical protein
MRCKPRPQAARALQRTRDFLELQIDAGLAVYVVPVRPLTPVLASAGGNF